jgi:hypothetical protein
MSFLDEKEENNFTSKMEQTNKATLEYLITPYYHNVIAARNKNNSKINEVAINKEDVRFYRKRIVAMTKEMLKGGTTDLPTPNKDIKHAYDAYVHQMIQYFKTIDRKDILQEQYLKNVTQENTDDDDDDDEKTKGLDEIDISTVKLEKVNELMMKKMVKISNLDNFVIQTQSEKNENRIIPVKKEIDLKAANLKTKGIKKKKKE